MKPQVHGGHTARYDLTSPLKSEQQEIALKQNK